LSITFDRRAAQAALFILEKFMQLTVRDVAKLLAVNEKTVYRWVQQSSLPGYRVNNQYRFNRAELLEWATPTR